MRSVFLLLLYILYLFLEFGQKINLYRPEIHCNKIYTKINKQDNRRQTNAMFWLEKLQTLPSLACNNWIENIIKDKKINEIKKTGNKKNKTPVEN